MRNLYTSRSSSSRETSASASASASASSSSARAPYDRSHPMAPPSSRQQPQIAALAKRTPVTPKLATKPTATTSSQRQTVTLATPVSRRSRPESVTSQGPSSNIGLSTTKRESLGREDYASPVSNFIQSNVTPRSGSGSRQSRASSANTSPNPADAAVDPWDKSGLGLSSSSSGYDSESLRRTGPTSVSRDSKFFYASDAPKGVPPTSQPKPTTAQQKGPTFFYANGSRPPAKPGSTVATSAPFSPQPLQASTPDLRDSKFMYANGTPDLKPSLMTSRPGSAVSTSSRAPSGRTANGPLSPALGAQRAPSPPKPSSHAQPPPAPPAPPPSAPPPQPTSGPSIAERRSMLASASQLGQTIASSRRVSSETPPRRTSGHSRSGSLVAEPPSATRVVISSPPSSSPLPSPLSFNNPGLSMASVLQAAEELAGDQDHDSNNDNDDESMVSDLASPKSVSGNDPLNELVANARRERKVQDLQITNASLEAINRTLERQLRKQTNELRRYKRLTRAGRLSSANTAPSSRNVSSSTTGDTPEGPLNNLSLSDLSEEDSDLDAEDEDLGSELSESDSTGSAQTSPDGKAVREVRHRRRDEKRLQIDLSKHQQLLVDSQKMNQSLKRCLGWTEELISEGKRALAYQVRVSEVDAGGNFAPDDGEQPYIYDGAQLWDHEYPDQNSKEDRSENSYTDEDDEDDPDKTMRLRIERLRPADQPGGNKSAQDRDSGIVLSGDGI